MERRDANMEHSPHESTKAGEHTAIITSPVVIPDHKLLRCIGRGSYGEVWLGSNVMGTYRAVKIVSCKAPVHDRPFERELAGIEKFEPISRSHEGFIDILQVGRNAQEGYFYYVMELGDDQRTGQEINPDCYLPKTLAKELALRGRLPVEECLQLGLSLSKALSQLHKHNLLHRDIKPSNIIFVNGTPKLADIGLVAKITEARSYVGTEGFIPPEGPGSPQADIYSLGKVLYEISTGKDRNDFPALPPQLSEYPDAERFLELNEVMVKACQNDLCKRYQSAEEMHADLVVLQNGKSVKRLRLLERRLANLTKAAIVAGIILVLGTAAVYRIGHERKQAAELRQRQVGGHIADGTHALEQGDYLGSLPSFVEALRLDQGDAQREETHRLRLRAILARCPRPVRLWSCQGRVHQAEFSPDGQRIVIAKWFDKAQVWDIESCQPASPPFGPGQGLEDASFSPDGKLVVTASQDKTACVWESVTGNKVLPLSHPGRVYSARFSPDGQRIVTACEDRLAYVWNAFNGRLETKLEGHKEPLTYAGFSKDGRLIVTSSKDKTARLWDAGSGKAIGAPLEHKSWVFYASFSPDGQRVVTAGFDRKARVWKVATSHEILPAMIHGDGVRSAEFSPDGRHIVTACLDATVRLWDADTGHPIPSNPILQHHDRVMRASFSSDGHRVLAACVDGTAWVWDLAASLPSPRPGKDSFSLDGSRFLSYGSNWFQVWDAGCSNTVSSRVVTQHITREAVLNRNGRFVLALIEPSPDDTSQENALQVWDVAAERAMSPLVPCTNALATTLLSDDGRRLLSFARTGAQIFDVVTGSAIAGIVPAQPIAQASLSRDGSRIITIGGAIAQIWDAKTGKELFPAIEHRSKVSYATFSPDGRRLVTCTADETFNRCSAHIWNAATGQAVGSPLQHNDGVLHASFSPDSQRIVTASEDFTAVVWDASTGRQLTPPLTHEDKVLEASFSANGRWVVTACEDKTAQVWDVATGRPLTPPLKRVSYIRHAKFIGNDQSLITVNREGEGWLWDLPRETRPVEDLALLAKLLAGHRSSGAVDSMPPSQDALRSMWQKLSAAYPSDFAAPRHKILAWHQREAALSEENQQWSAAIFHLDRLLGMTPKDQLLVRRRGEAQRKLAEREPGNGRSENQSLGLK